MPEHASDAWRAVFSETAPFALADERRLPHSQFLDPAGLVDRVLSISFIAALPPAEQQVVEALARELAGNARVELHYVAEMFVYAQARRL